MALVCPAWHIYLCNQQYSILSNFGNRAAVFAAVTCLLVFVTAAVIGVTLGGACWEELTFRVSAATAATSCLLASISCFILVLSIIAEFSRLSRKVFNFLYVAGVLGTVAEFACPLNGSSPPVAQSSRLRSKYAWRYAVFHTVQVLLVSGKCSQSSMVHGKCCNERTLADTIATSWASNIGNSLCASFFLTSSSWSMFSGMTAVSK